MVQRIRADRTAPIGAKSLRDAGALAPSSARLGKLCFPRRGKQNYHCKECDRQFIVQYTARGYSMEVKENCLKMYVNGLGFRAQGVCAQVQRLSPQSHAMHDDGALAPFLRRFKALLCAKELQGSTITLSSDGLEALQLPEPMPLKFKRFLKLLK